LTSTDPKDSALDASEDQQKQRYDESYFSLYREDPKRSAMYLSERDHILGYKSSGRILDVGCGIGMFLSVFPDQDWEKYGTDISDVAIAEARARGIQVKDYEQAYDYQDGFFDVIVFRGSLQLISTPFAVVKHCIELLASGGCLVFLSAPNSNSPYYRRFKTLPFLTPHGNFLIPSDIMMKNALQNYGLDVLEIRYPYLGGPYARPLMDHFWYLMSFLGVSKKFPFWRSSMEIYARKP